MDDTTVVVAFTSYYRACGYGVIADSCGLWGKTTVVPSNRSYVSNKRTERRYQVFSNAGFLVL